MGGEGGRDPNSLEAASRVKPQATSVGISKLRRSSEIPVLRPSHGSRTGDAPGRNRTSDTRFRKPLILLASLLSGGLELRFVQLSPTQTVSRPHIALEFRILGPLEVAAGRELLPLGPAKRRAVLAVLLLSRGTTVSLDGLVDAVWGGAAPATAAKSVQNHVSHLRKLLPPTCC